jgi:hypothetical protein
MMPSLADEGHDFECRKIGGYERGAPVRISIVFSAQSGLSQWIESRNPLFFSNSLLKNSLSLQL